jgi:hypothetical protein
MTRGKRVFSRTAQGHKVISALHTAFMVDATFRRRPARGQCMRITVIGLGRMGRALADRLLDEED